MPYKEHIVKKRYYSITEVANELNTSYSKIRFWLRELGIDAIHKNDWNLRIRHDDFEKIKELFRLDNLLTLKGKKEYLKGTLKIEFK